MAWKEVKVDQQRKSFIEAYFQEKFTLAELCRQFSISRPTAYKWINRYKEEGPNGLKERNRAPLHQFCATDPLLIKEILNLKFVRNNWGPKKIRGHLVTRQPTVLWPSTTTIGNILDRHGLVIPRKYRKRFPAKTDPLSHTNKSNDVWSVE